MINLETIGNRPNNNLIKTYNIINQMIENGQLDNDDGVRAIYKFNRQVLLEEIQKRGLVI